MMERRAWFKEANETTWSGFDEVRQTYPTADQVSRIVVFNVGGNRYRLAARVDYQWQKLFVRAVMMHAEYSKGAWKRDQWL